jgi:uncharacterized protein (TIGR01777 family)
MNITVTGGNGFIGRHLVDGLVADGHSVRVLGRNPHRNLPSSVSFFRWDATREELPAESIADADAIVNLAGEPIAQIWTRQAKIGIRESRVSGTRRLVQAFSRLSKRPGVLVSASAVGYYGARNAEVLTETSAPGHGFLAEVCTAWEREADAAEGLGIRVVKLRNGVVLSKDGGALEQMLRPFKMGVGGKLGTGKQWMSWIHIDDAVGLIRFALDQPLFRGAANATAPNPVTNADFTRSLSHALHRPAFLSVPAFALKTLLGEMSHVLLDSQRVLPREAEAAGYAFRYRELNPALEQIFAR